MSKRRGIGRLRTTDDILSYAERRGLEVIRGSKHWKIRGPRGESVTAPYSSRLDPVTLRAIVKKFLAWGLTVLAGIGLAVAIWVQILRAVGVSVERLLAKIVGGL